MVNLPDEDHFACDNKMFHCHSILLKHYTAQKMKFSTKDFFIFCAVLVTSDTEIQIQVPVGSTKAERSFPV